MDQTGNFNWVNGAQARMQKRKKARTSGFGAAPPTKASRAEQQRAFFASDRRKQLVAATEASATSMFGGDTTSPSLDVQSLNTRNLTPVATLEDPTRFAVPNGRAPRVADATFDGSKIATPAVPVKPQPLFMGGAQLHGGIVVRAQLCWRLGL